MVLTPTKLIIIGEHAVSYGVSALSLPLQHLPTIITVEKNPESGSTLQSNYPLAKEHKEYLESQVKTIVESFSITEELQLHIDIQLSVPPGIGLGVSASIAVGLVRALSAFYNQGVSKQQLLKITAQLEKENHGFASGIDHTTIIENAPLLYSKENDTPQYVTLPELRSDTILGNCYLVNTGIPKESTKDMVAFVAERYEQNTHATKILFQKIGVMTPIVQAALQRDDAKVFRDILNEAGMVLEQLGIVNERTQEFSQKIREHNGMAKISGAGGRSDFGSGILLVWHGDKDFVENICAEYGFQYWRLSR